MLTFYSTACEFITPDINLFTEDEKRIIIDNTYFLRGLNSKFTKSSNENKRRLQYKAASKVLCLNIDAHMLSKKYSGNLQSKYDTILNFPVWLSHFVIAAKAPIYTRICSN